MQNIGFHSITVAGRASEDPTVRYYDSGSVRTTFKIAVRSRFDEATFDSFPVEIWGRQAQIAADHVRAGSSVGVVGTLHRESAAEPTYVRVDHFQLLDNSQFTAPC